MLSNAAKRATLAEYAFPGRDGIRIGMQHTSKTTPTRSFTLALDPARRLDLEAAIELQHGHVAAAEMLARRAADLREARR